MAIDFKAPAFGQPKAATKDERPKAEYWINLGYNSDFTPEGDDKPLFISLPQGIPLDTQEHLPTNSSNQQFAAMRAAQNGLLDQLIEYASKLQPGESTEINLTVQLRRVKEAQAPIDPAQNPLHKKLNFSL